MDTVNYLLLWLHFIGMASALGAGIGLSQTGPRLVRAPPDQREVLWTLEKLFSRIGAVGLGILIVTGPLMVWLKFGGFEGFSWWFGLKMLFVVLAIVSVGTHEWAGRRFYRGDESAIPLMFVSGRIAGASIVLAMLCAVITFN